MTKRMLIDATHKEETRVAITDGNKLVDYDYENQGKKPLKGNIYLAKVTRVEPSLQAAFVNYGGNRHGFLPFSEIHPDYFRIPVSDREALMAEQEALLQEHDEVLAQEDAMEEDTVPDAEISDEEDATQDVEEDLEVSEVSEAPDEAEVLDADEADESDDANGNVAPKEEGEKDPTEDGEGEPKQAEGDDNESRGRGRYKGRNNKGRKGGRGGGRAQHKNRNVEVVGGEDFDAEQKFRFNLRRKYKIQEVIKRGQIMLVQVNKEERGNKGAAVGSYLSLPGRYCVLMPNSPRGGGVSRKIANGKDRARMREIVKDLDIPKGMSVIVRTAGVARTKVEIKRDLDYLMRLWDNIRELTLQSTAPTSVYEEADLIKRSVRDLYTRDVEEILVAGEAGYRNAKDFMKMMIPSHIKKVKQYEDDQLPLFHRYQLESQINEIGQIEVRLRSGGYLVINPTEALVSIDVNSGKATKGRHIEETALKTNLEAAEEVARQLKLRDLGGLVVIDFIDMEDRRSNGKVERRMKESLSDDRARVQVGRISSFGLMELSRQRLSPSLTEAQFETCNSCKGVGLVRTADAMSIMVLRGIEEEGIRARAAQIIVHMSNDVALYILNYKRKKLAEVEARYGFQVLIRVEDDISQSEFRIEVSKPSETDSSAEGDDEKKPEDTVSNVTNETEESDDKPKRRRGRRGGRNRNKNRTDEAQDNNEATNSAEENASANEANEAKDDKAVEVTVVSDETPKVEVQAETEVAEEKPKRRRAPRKPKVVAEADAVAPVEVKQDVVVANDDAVSTESEDKKPRKKAVRKKPAAKSEVKSEEDKPKKSLVKRVAKPKKAAPVQDKAVEDAAPKPEPVQEVPASDFEVVNEPPKEKKKGWWNR